MRGRSSFDGGKREEQMRERSSFDRGTLHEEKNQREREREMLKLQASEETKS